MTNGSVYIDPSAPRYKTFRPFEDATLAALEDAHGRIEVVTGAAPPPSRWKPNDAPEPPWEAVFRVPTSGETDFFEQHANGSDKAKSAALRNLAKAIVVAVSVGGKQTIHTQPGDATTQRAVRSAWDDLRDHGHPGAHLAAQDTVMSLSSMGREEAGKG